MTPHYASVAIFTAFVALEGEEALTPAKVFTVISVFSLIATPMRNMMMTITNLMSARASMARLDHFLDFKERS